MRKIKERELDMLKKKKIYEMPSVLKKEYEENFRSM